ncbi:MAG: hypothetical protein AAGF71_10360 [Pseudomonadota bacterium]
MEDLFMEGEMGDQIVFVTPLSHKMYREANAHGMGGADGYFVCASSKSRPEAGFEVLAKAATIDAAQLIFSALIASGKRSVA